jgi:hypothetical protein
MSLITRTEKGSKLTIAEMDGNLTYLEQLAQSGFKKITIPLGIQNVGTIEINSVNYNYYTLNEENLFFGQGSDISGDVSNDLFSFYEDVDGLIHLGTTLLTTAIPA